MISLPLPADLSDPGLSCHELVEALDELNGDNDPATFGPSHRQWAEVDMLKGMATAWIIKHPDQYVLLPQVDHNGHKFHVHWLLMSPALDEPCEYPDGQIREAISVSPHKTDSITSMEVALDFCHILNRARQERTQADA